MNSIILSLTVAMTPEINYTETGTITSSSILCLMGSCPIRVHCWGKLASAIELLQINSPLIVTGALHVQNTCFKIAADSIQPGAPGLNLNHVDMVGRAGNNPELRYFESGKAVAKFQLALKRNKEITDWLSLECWDRTAEITADYVRKGSQVGVSGSLVIEAWNDKSTGEPRAKPVVKVNKIHLLGGNKSEQSKPVAA